MRIDTSGNNFDSHGSSHRITHGFHNHHEHGENNGHIRSLSQDISQGVQAPVSETQGEGPGFWRTFADSAKNLWGRIWGESQGVNEIGNIAGDAVGDEQLMAQVGPANMAEGSGMDTHGPTVAAAASVAQGAFSRENPYFTTVEDENVPKDSFMRRMKIRFRELTNQFKKQFSGRFGRKTGEFSGRGTLNSGQQKPKEDLRRHSRYREDGLEMDCVLTDDSYLMDSYDRSGGYSRLTTDMNTKNK